jgi:prepilin-type N-terminal cleavage/methylation domain-containing protein
MQLTESEHDAGFILIEMSIVLAIIGLLAGGILVGQDIIASAGARTLITQIERYNAAINIFPPSEQMGPRQAENKRGVSHRVKV